MDKYASLTPEMLAILRDKATEAPFSGRYYEPSGAMGSYLCQGCGLALFRGDDQFTSSCGWPSFDNELPNAISRQTDADGIRTEILCRRCGGHLGHVFAGEGLTGKNLRYCVNSCAVDFVTNSSVVDTEEAIVAAGCFWGVQYYFDRLDGVLKTEVGYTGGSVTNPDYQTVCRHNTGHFEAIRVIYNPKKLSYTDILKYFFEIHDPAQSDGQGPDIGSQYLSAIFYFNDDQEKVAKAIIIELEQLGHKVATLLRPVTAFWPAEEYHQEYYIKTQKTPYCHRRVKRFK